METSNYLMDFLHKVDVLISEINKLNSKIRLYQKNSNTFGIAFDVRFSILPDNFIKLRDFLHEKIENGNYYDREIVNLKREVSRQFSYIVVKIEQEIVRIDSVQEQEMNKIVKATLYNARIKNEIDLRNSFYIKSSIFDKFLGIEKYRKLSYTNHDLKAKLIEREYETKLKERKSIFELVSMIENENVKNGEVLCLQDEMIKAFMIDRNVIKRSSQYSWKQADLLPRGVFEKRAYYKVLNKNLIAENEKLENDLRQNLRNLEIVDKNFNFEKLMRINTKLTKILKGGLRTNV